MSRAPCSLLGHLEVRWLSQLIRDQAIGVSVSMWGLNLCDVMRFPFCLWDKLMGMISRNGINRYDT